MLQVLPLALAAAVYPTLLAGVIVILSRPRPVRLLVGFLVGGMLVSVTAGLLIVDGLQNGADIRTSGNATRPIVDIVAGLVSLSVAWAAWRGHLSRLGDWRRRRRPPKPGPNWTDRALGGGSVPVAFAVGVALNLPGIWYLAALADIAEADPSPAVEVLVIIVFNLIMFMLVEIPLVFYLVNPERARSLVDLGSRWARSHSTQVGVTIASIVGTYLVVRGVVAAVS